jgi:hypothetical protein
MNWRFYDAITGVFSGRTFQGSARLVALNIPAGYDAIEGIYDPLAQRVDVATGQVVAYTPPRAELDAIDRERRRALAQHAVDTIEVQQARVLREAVLALLPLLPDSPAKTQLQTRLQQFEDQIAARRGDL